MSARAARKAIQRRDQRQAAFDKLPPQDQAARTRPGSLNRSKHGSVKKIGR